MSVADERSRATVKFDGATVAHPDSNSYAEPSSGGPPASRPPARYEYVKVLTQTRVPFVAPPSLLRSRPWKTKMSVAVHVVVPLLVVQFSHVAEAENAVLPREVRPKAGGR